MVDELIFDRRLRINANYVLPIVEEAVHTSNLVDAIGGHKPFLIQLRMYSPKRTGINMERPRWVDICAVRRRGGNYPIHPNEKEQSLVGFMHLIPLTREEVRLVITRLVPDELVYPLFQNITDLLLEYIEDEGRTEVPAHRPLAVPDATGTGVYAPTRQAERTKWIRSWETICKMVKDFEEEGNIRVEDSVPDPESMLERLMPIWGRKITRKVLNQIIKAGESGALK